MHVLGDSRGGVQRDRRPHRIDFRLGDVVLPQEPSRSVRTIYFEPVRLAAIPRSQTHVAEHRGNVKLFGIELQSSPFSSERREIIHTSRVVEQQRRLGVTHQLILSLIHISRRM